RSRSIVRADELSSGSPSGAAVGKNAAPSHCRPELRNISTISLHSISSPMTLKNVEHTGVTRVPAISTRTTSAVKAPASANARVSQSRKSPAESKVSDLDKGQLRKFLLKQHPERIAALVEIPGFEFCQSVRNGAGRLIFRWRNFAQDRNNHR